MRSISYISTSCMIFEGGIFLVYPWIIILLKYYFCLSMIIQFSWLYVWPLNESDRLFRSKMRALNWLFAEYIKRMNKISSKRFLVGEMKIKIFLFMIRVAELVPLESRLFFWYCHVESMLYRTVKLIGHFSCGRNFSYFSISYWGIGQFSSHFILTKRLDVKLIFLGLGIRVRD